MSAAPRSLGVVVIGRNEAPRLRRCLDSVINQAAAVVYVDSASRDDSVRIARSLAVEVVELDAGPPLTAARSRNAGVHRLCIVAPNVELVQFIDGDCEMDPSWLPAAMREMLASPRVAVVCGRRRERHPDASIYNRLCDMEWDTPLGEAEACGGDALVRLSAFQEAGGYDETLIAGEEPELCLRLRLHGWAIRRIDHEMTLHDAQLSRFGQWWKRAVRSGHAYAEGRAMHGAQHGYCVREVRSIVEWALLLPLACLALAWPTWGLSMALLPIGYGLLWRRVRAHRLRKRDRPDHASLYAGYCVLGKFAQLAGIARYWWNRIRRRRSALIEYKHAEPRSAVPAEAARP